MTYTDSMIVYIFFFYLILEEISFQKIDIHTSHYYQSCVSMHTNFSTYILSILQTFTICASKRFLSIVLTGLCNWNTIILPSACKFHGLFNLLSFSLYVLWVNPRQHAGYSLVYIYTAVVVHNISWDPNSFLPSNSYCIYFILKLQL